MKRSYDGESKGTASLPSDQLLLVEDSSDGSCCTGSLWCQASTQETGNADGSNGSAENNNGAFTRVVPSGKYRQFKPAVAPLQRENPADSLTLGELLLASELKRLSVVEREAVYEDIHGVLPVRVETEELLNTSLREMDISLRLLRKGRDSYDKACFLNKAFATSRTLRIMFLRATQYDTNLAAKGLVLHFTIKLKLFGMDKLVRDIVWEDVDEDGRECLRRGSLQYISSTKRPMLVDIWDQWKYHNFDSHARSMWWIVMRAMNESRNNSLLIIGYTLNSSSQRFAKAPNLRKYQFRSALPLHISSFHVCLENVAYRNLFSALMAALPTSIRLRTKFHFGSTMECKYELNSFGIDSNEIIVWTDEDEADQSNSRRANRIQANLSQLRVGDDIAPRMISPEDGSPEMVHYPLSTDILLGRGIPYQVNPGNIALNGHMQTYLQQYIDTKNRKAKAEITTTVVQEIQKQGSRFLKRQDDNWEVVDDETARQRIGMGFRNLSRKL